MDKRVESQYSPWKLVKEEWKTDPSGTSVRHRMSAIFPLIKPALESGNQWIRDSHHIDSNALPATIISIVALAFFVWPGPILLRWSKSYGRGVNRGSFAVPAVAAFAPWDFAIGCLCLVGSLYRSDRHSCVLDCLFAVPAIWGARSRRRPNGRSANVAQKKPGLNAGRSLRKLPGIFSTRERQRTRCMEDLGIFGLLPRRR